MTDFFLQTKIGTFEVEKIRGENEKFFKKRIEFILKEIERGKTKIKMIIRDSFIEENKERFGVTY